VRIKGCTIDLHSDRAHKQIERNDEASAVFSSQDGTRQTFQWTAQHAHSLTTPYIMVGSQSMVLRKAGSNRVDFLGRHGSGLTVRTDKPDDARNLQRLEPIAQGDPDENVSREEGELQVYSTVLPAAHTFIEWKETLDRSSFKL
jgi:hypothetical protein